ncbi:MAG: VOC family protein [Burkholderiales bacterium]|nr:VOC family protein [Burkholderiales bacterium]
MLNHAAFVTHDAALTADFYTRVMGMEIAHTVVDDYIPSTETSFPFIHLFFRMGDGATLAFFESPCLPSPAKPSHPVYDIFNHFAFHADTREEVRRWRDWLARNGVEVRGPVDHDGQFLSIYFHDPSGLRLEVTAPTDSSWNRHTEEARRDLEYWVQAKERARREGADTSSIVGWVREAREDHRNRSRSSG